MRIPVDHVDLGTLGYEGYWIEMPRSIKEGFLHEFSKLGRTTNGTATGEDDNDAEQSREGNIKILELVTAWNIDDESGKILPILSKCKSKAEKEKVIAELPVDVIVHVAQRIAGTVEVPEKTKDFSNGSSGQR